jgi:hypothetical protein
MVVNEGKDLVTGASINAADPRWRSAMSSSALEH